MNAEKDLQKIMKTTGKKILKTHLRGQRLNWEGSMEGWH